MDSSAESKDLQNLSDSTTTTAASKSSSLETDKEEPAIAHEAVETDTPPVLGDLKLGLSSTFVATGASTSTGAANAISSAPAETLPVPKRWTFRYGPAYARPFNGLMQKVILVLATLMSLMGPFAATMYSPGEFVNEWSPG